MKKQVVLEAILGRYTAFTENLFDEVDKAEYRDNDELENEIRRVASSTISDYIEFESEEIEIIETDIVKTVAEDIIKKHKAAFLELAK